MHIQHLNNREIDKRAWDETILNAPNGNLYANSWYLDMVCPGWSALVGENYSCLMPLTANRKYGFSYIYRPILSQQLGLFSLKPTEKRDLNDFILAIPSKFRLIQYCFNKHNDIPEAFGPINHTTYELKLHPGYERLESAYSENHRRNIRKASLNGLELTEDVTVNEFISLLKKDQSPGSRVLSSGKNAPVLTRLIRKMQLHNAVKITGLLYPTGQLIACVLFGFSHNCWYYLVPVSSAEGRDTRALFIIIDHLVKQRAGKKETIDFEGSDIPGLAKFYSGFGAEPSYYQELRKNSLPWPIKFLK